MNQETYLEQRVDGQINWYDKKTNGIRKSLRF